MKPQRVANITLNASIAVLSKDPLAVLRSFVQAHGTSEGVRKAWDTRGRGRKQEPKVYATHKDIRQSSNWGEIQHQWLGKAGQGEGSLVKGIPMTKEEVVAKYPTLYHVTTHGAEIQDSGLLLAGSADNKGGLGSSNQARAVSFTTSLADAHDIQSDITQMIELAKNPEFSTLEKLAHDDEKRSGLKDGALDAAVAQARRNFEVNWEQTVNNGKASPERKESGLKDAYNMYLWGRDSAGGGQNTIIFGDLKDFRNLDAGKVSVLAVPSKNIPDGALCRDEVSNKFLHELQVDADVPVDGVKIQAYGTSEGVKKAWDTRGRSTYPKASDTVDGLHVGKDIPNTDSIAATLSDNHEIQQGIREVPMSEFNSKPTEMFYAADDIQRTKDLAERIKQSGEINPLIVVVDKDGPYILEGGHRLGALNILSKQKFPALVVHDTSSDMGIQAYGTSEGVKKAWDTRGRGRHEQAATPQLHGLGKIGDVKSPQEIYKAYGQWRSYWSKTDNEHVQATHAVGIMRDIASSYENMEKKGDNDGGFVKSEAMRDQKGNIVAAVALSAIGKDNLMLDYLTVHPAVLMGKVDAKGVGTRMMVEAAKYAQSVGKGIKLFALEGAEGFYRKCGMKEDGGVYSFDKQQVKDFVERVGK